MSHTSTPKELKFKLKLVEIELRIQRGEINVARYNIHKESTNPLLIILMMMMMILRMTVTKGEGNRRESGEGRGKKRRG